MIRVSQTHFAFIGGGSTGPVLIIYMAQFAAAKHADLFGHVFHLIDPRGFGNGGMAYGQNHPNHLLNTRRNEMSPWNKMAFHDYLVSIGRGADELEFNLRSDIHTFLAHEFAQAKQTLEALGATFVEHRRAAYVRRTSSGFNVQDESGDLIDLQLTNLPGTNIFLTVGYGPNDTFAALRSYEKFGFIDSQYPPEALAQALRAKPRPDRVAVIGSAAAMYDFVITCPFTPAQMNLTIFSSAIAGLEVRQVEREHLLKDLKLNHLRTLPDGATIDQLERAIQQEFVEAIIDQAGPPTWVAFRIMGIIGSVLMHLDVAAAQTFRASPFFKNLKRLGGPTTAASKSKLDTYNPTFIRAEIGPTDITLQPDKTFVILAGGRQYQADIVINATGHGRHNSPILDDLKIHNLASVEPKLGILTTDKTGYILPESGLACIGPATHFGTDGLETFAGPAAHLASSIVTRLLQSTI